MGLLDVKAILSGASVSALAKVTGGEGLLGYGIRALTERVTFWGRAVTALCPFGDNGALHMAIAQAGPGDVIVGATGGLVAIGMWGGISSTAAMQRGISALVLDGYVTDVDEIRESGFCVFARGSSAYPPIRKTKGYLNVPVLVEGVVIHPGDILVGDVDGVIAIRPDALEEVARGYFARVKKESEIIDKVKAGTSTVSIFGIQ